MSSTVPSFVEQINFSLVESLWSFLSWSSIALAILAGRRLQSSYGIRKVLLTRSWGSRIGMACFGEEVEAL